MSVPDRRFPWRATADVLREVASAVPLRGDGRRAFVPAAGAGGPRVELPGVLPPPAEGIEVADYLEALPPSPGREVVVLLQAGAAALGLWEDDVLVDHVARKRYVVRGRGRAQATHLRTRGKSRYGSRLRLQNHRRLLEETNGRLVRWWHERGPFDRVHRSVPVRIWPELWAVDPAPPFAPEDGQRIPFHVHVPAHRELLRVRRLLTTGRVTG